jgi:hypothetical protein
MTFLALETAESVLAVIGLALGLVVAGLVVGLFNRVVRPALEIQRYSEDILEAGLGIGRNLDGVDELAKTHALVMAVPDLAVAYLKKLGKV